MGSFYESNFNLSHTHILHSHWLLWMCKKSVSPRQVQIRFQFLFCFLDSLFSSVIHNRLCHFCIILIRLLRGPLLWFQTNLHSNWKTKRGWTLTHYQEWVTHDIAWHLIGTKWSFFILPNIIIFNKHDFWISKTKWSTSSLVYVLETLGTLGRLHPWDFQSKWQFQNTSVVKSPSLRWKAVKAAWNHFPELGN